MRFFTFASESEGYGALIDDQRAVDLTTAFAWHEADQKRPSDMAHVAALYGATLLELIEREQVALPVARALVDRARAGALPTDFAGRPTTFRLDQVRILAPLPRPSSVRDGYAFRQHVETARRNRGLGMIPEFDQFPVFYFTNHHGVVGPGDVPVLPAHLERLDYELEGAVVVGRGGKNLDVAGADAAIFGLCIMNDWSARALQMEEMKLNLGPAKGKDFATSLGPWLVTVDELAPHATKTPRGTVWDLGMRARVNGDLLSQGNLRD